MNESRPWIVSCRRNRHQPHQESQFVFVRASDAESAEGFARDLTGKRHCTAQPYHPEHDPELRRSGFVRCTP